MCQRISARHWVDGPHLLILHMIGHSECKCCGLKTTIAHCLRANQGRADPVDECQVMARVVQEQVLNLMSFPPAGPAAKRLRGSLDGENVADIAALATTTDPSPDFPWSWTAQKLMTLPLSKSSTKLSTGNGEPRALFNSYLVKMQKSNPWRPPLMNLVMSKFAMARVKPLSRNRQGNSDSGWRSWLTAMSWPASNILKSMPCKICGQSFSWPTWISCSAIKSWVWGRRMRTEALPPRLHLRWCSPMTIRSEKKPWNSWTTAWGCQQLWRRRERMCPWKSVSLWLQHPWTLSPACKTPKPGQGHPSQAASGTATHILQSPAGNGCVSSRRKAIAKANARTHWTATSRSTAALQTGSRFVFDGTTKVLDADTIAEACAFARPVFKITHCMHALAPMHHQRTPLEEASQRTNDGAVPARPWEACMGGTAGHICCRPLKQGRGRTTWTTSHAPTSNLSAAAINWPTNMGLTALTTRLRQQVHLRQQEVETAGRCRHITKAKTRTIHDGGGLCSGGRWAVAEDSIRWAWCGAVVSGLQEVFPQMDFWKWKRRRRGRLSRFCGSWQSGSSRPPHLRVS